MDTDTPAFLNIHKSAGWSSHDVVAYVRKCLRIKRVGHGGTLDPMACGVLPVALNRACRLLRFLPDQKTYLAEILLGTTSDTDDITGTVTSSTQDLPDAEDIRRVLTANFIGNFEQVPPDYSAVHIGGKRLYQLARSGAMPDNIPARSVTVYKLELLQIELPVLKVRIICSGGFYVRSLARDLGQKLGCGGCLKSLLREQAGNFKVEDAISLDQLAAKKDSLCELLISPAAALPFAQLDLNEDQARALIKGQKVHCSLSGQWGREKEDLGCQPSVDFSLPPALVKHSQAEYLRSEHTVKVMKSSSVNEDKTQAMPLLLSQYRGKLIAVCRRTSDEQLLPEVVLADPF